MIVLVVKLIILGFLVYGAKQYYLDQPNSNSRNVDNVPAVTPVIQNVLYERLPPIVTSTTTRTTTTTTPIPTTTTTKRVNLFKKSCGRQKFCVPYQNCNSTAEIEKIDRHYIDYSDTNKKCGYLHRCCDKAKVIKLNTNEQHGEPLIYKNCSFAADYAHKHGSKDESGSQIETISLPWVVNIVQRIHFLPSESFICAGTLIAPNVVLSDMSSFQMITYFVGDLFVHAGEFSLNAQSKNTQVRRVSRKFDHEPMKILHERSGVVLLELESSFQLGAYIQPICLPPRDDLFDYDNCLIAGFPRLKNNEHSEYQLYNPEADYNLEKRQRFTLTPLPAKDHCPKVLTEPKTICIGKEVDDGVCHADEGSAIACAKRGTLDFYLVALSLKNRHCNGAFSPGTNINVAFYQVWIETRLAELDTVVP